MNTKQLRQKILDLAIKGKLVPQDPNDEPASKLLERIREEKEQLIKDGKLKRDKNESYIFVGYDKLHYEKFSDGSVVCIEDEIPFEIPENWAWTKLGHICNIARGGSPRPIESYLTDNENGINWIKIGDTEKGGKYIYSTKEKIKPEGISKSRFVKSGDFLLTNSMSFGRPYILKTDGCIHDGWLVINDDFKAFDQDFLYYLLSSNIMYQLLALSAKGSTVQNLKSDTVKDVYIVLPPIQEQKRISKYIENILEIVETLENDKIDLSELIKQTKAKVLDLAIKGKLVPQNPEDEPADILLEKIREKKEKLIKEGKLKRDKNETFIFKNSDDNSYYEQIDGETICIDDDLPFEIPDSWRWCRLKDIGTIVGGGTPKTEVKENWENGNIPWLTPADMRNIKSKYVKCGARNITLQGYNSSSAVMLSPNSIVYSSRAPIGYVAITRNSLCTNQGFKSVDLYYKECSNYAYYLLKALTTDIVNRASGTTFKEISGSEFGQTFVPLPPLNEQIKIGENIDSIFGYLDKLETIIKGS